MKKRLCIVGLFILVLLIVFLIWYFFFREAGAKRPPTLLKTASGLETNEFQLNDSLLFDAVDLEPRTGYTIRVAAEGDRIITQSRLSTDRYGHIPETVLWYDIGVRPCYSAAERREAAVPEVYAHLSDEEIMDFQFAGRDYTVQIMLGEQLIRETMFRVSEIPVRPVLYAADSRGCPKSGFLIGEEDIWVVGKNFPKGSIVRVWAVPASMDWKEGDSLEDMTKQYYGELPPLFELQGNETGFMKLLWPKGLTSIGSYDIAAEVITYPFGSYHASTSADVQNVVSHTSYSGFVIQRRQGAEPLEMNMAGSYNSPLTYQDTFLTNESVYVGIDPSIQPAYQSQTADIYIVQHKTEAQWISNNNLTDVTGFVESVTIHFVCSNCWVTLAWAAPLTPGEYDVVLDFNNNGKYDNGTDLIDSLDAVGFYVSDVRVDKISFNYSGSNAVTIYDNYSGSNVTAPEYSGTYETKPAAYVRGGSHQVQVQFKAIPTITQANLWAVGGLGGLAGSGSPVTVSFSSGSGQQLFTVNSVPNSVGKHQFYWDWQYIDTTGSPSPTKDMGRTGEHLIYTVLAAPVASLSPPWLVILDYACTWANGSTTKEQVCTNILNNGYVNHYTWNMDCHRLASDFVRMVGTQGISASQHNWASLGSYSAIGDMAYQKTKVIDPVGPTWGNQAIEWSWHQWAEAEGAQRDPSAAASVVGNWGVYEDYLFWQYKKVDNDSPYSWSWVNNQPGQISGCEAPAHRSYNSNPTLYSWRGPDR